MLIKFIDEKGNISVVNVPDNSDFRIEDDRDGLCYVAAHLPKPVPSRTLPVKRVVGALDRNIANRCVEKIYDQLKSNKTDCDWTDIQRGISDGSEEADE